MLVGLTGGIGSGKSTVAQLFKLLGGVIFNSDLAAKEVYYEKETRLKIINLLGENAYESPTKIDKDFIGRKIFSDTDLLHQLNAIIHPAVKEKFIHFTNQHPQQLIIKETALLFEANLEKEVDKIIVVTSDLNLRIKRLTLRDGLTLEHINKKIKSQLSDEEKIKRADFIIYNNETQLLIPQVISIFNQLKG